MELPFVITALVILAGAIGAVSLRNLVHCALSLAVCFAGLAVAFLQLEAQFVGLAQILVYVGAVAILVVFAILLTRGNDPNQAPVPTSSAILGLGIAGLVFAVLAVATLSSSMLDRPTVAPPEATVLQIGQQLMTTYVLALQVIGLVLTVALIGAVLIAMPEKSGGTDAAETGTSAEPKTDSPDASGPAPAPLENALIER
jgi:NADH-quinone oxidoreductase subunit J